MKLESLRLGPWDYFLKSSPQICTPVILNCRQGCKQLPHINKLTELYLHCRHPEVAIIEYTHVCYLLKDCFVTVCFPAIGFAVRKERLIFNRHHTS